MAASLLHNTCKLFPTTLSVIESAVHLDPEAIHTAIPTLCSAKHTRNTSMSHHQHSPMSSTANVYSFPLNIALQHNASNDVISFLMQKYPAVLTKLDGPNQTGSLSIALSFYNSDEAGKSTSCLTPTTQTTTKATCGNKNWGTLAKETIVKTEDSRMDQLIRMFVLAKPDCVKILDRRKNTALHYLAKRRAHVSCESISLVYQLYPEALHMRNCIGQTPVQVAQQNPTITDQLLDHWHECSYWEQEIKLEQSLIQMDHELDENSRKAPPMDFGPAYDLPLSLCGTTGITGSMPCVTSTNPTNTTATTAATNPTTIAAVKASNASAYFLPSVMASSKKNYDKQYDSEKGTF